MLYTYLSRHLLSIPLNEDIFIPHVTRKRVWRYLLVPFGNNVFKNKLT